MYPRFMRSAFLKLANLILEIYALIFARVTFRNWNAWLVQLGFRGLGVLNHRTDFLSGKRQLNIRDYGGFWERTHP